MKELKNKSTKRKENASGITLIALIITIIVLLILAGVTIAQITSNESAPQKAVEARKKNEEGAAKEAALLLTTDYIQEYYEDKYVESQTTASNPKEYISEKLENEQEKGGYKFIVKNGKIEVNDLEGNKLAKGKIQESGLIEWEEDAMLPTYITYNGEKVDLSTLDKESVAECYGTSVANINGIDYGLFYVDYDGKYSNGDKGTIYLKAKTPIDYISLSNPDYTSEAISIMKQLNPDWKEHVVTVEKTNEMATAYLCNPEVSIWKSQRETIVKKYGENKFNYVIGAPSAELFMESYNDKYKSGYSVHYKDKDESWRHPGYLYSNDGGTTLEVSYSMIIPDANAENGMYKQAGASMWLASPLFYNFGNYCVLCIQNSGSLNSEGVTGSCYVTPLISLKPGIDFTLN